MLISNSGVTTIQANSVALGTDTTGNYVAGNTSGNGISITGTAGEAWSPTVSINSPTCAGTTKLQWNGTAFVCSADVDTDTDTDDQTLSYNSTNRELTISEGNTVTFPLASTSVTGLLSDTDWDTFNSKENVLTFTGNGLFSRTGDTITAATCGTTGHVMKWNGTAFACAADNDTTYSAGTGITLSSGQFSLTNDFGASIDGGEITNGTIASADIGTGAVESTNILDGTIDFDDIATNGCAANEIIKRNAGNTAWACAVDVDTNTDAVSTVFGRSGAVTATNGDYTASQVTNVAAGSIAAITVQNAINELDTEKLSVTLSDGQIWVGNGLNVATAVTASGDVLISNTGVTTVQSNSVALGTDTTGNYVAGNTAGTGISISGSAGEGWTQLLLSQIQQSVPIPTRLQITQTDQWPFHNLQ